MKKLRWPEIEKGSAEAQSEKDDSVRYLTKASRLRDAVPGGERFDVS